MNLLRCVTFYSVKNSVNNAQLKAPTQNMSLLHIYKCTVQNSAFIFIKITILLFHQ